MEENHHSSQILEKFSGWLDETMREAEAMPVSHDTVPEPDLFSLLSEMGSLKEEVRLQNRKSGKAISELHRAIELVEPISGALKTLNDSVFVLQHQLRSGIEKELLLGFLEMRDVLSRSSRALKKPGRTFFFFKQDESLYVSSRKNFELAIGRFDQMIKKFGVMPVECLNRAFDPNFMVAIGTQSDPKVAEGLVVDEALVGFVRDNNVLRMAQVVVNRK